MSDRTYVETHALERALERVAELGTELELERQRADGRERVEVVAVRRRVARGLCPLCDFESRAMALHVAAAHPTFDTEAV